MTAIHPRSLAMKRRRMAIEAGTWRYRVPAEPVIAHIATLRTAGMSAGAIATASGLGLSIISPLTWTASKRARTWVLPATADAILAVTIADSPDWARVPVVGTIRRIEAMQCMGWSLTYLAGRMGVTTEAVSGIKRATNITVRRARSIADLYDELAMRPGPDRKTRAWATRLGYAPPLAWDDDTIDDPAATPEGAGYKRGPVIEQVRELEAMGLTRAGIADRLGVTVNAIERAIDRANAGSAAA